MRKKMALFRRPKYIKVTVSKKKNIPGGLWTKCEDCGEIIYNKKLEENLYACPKCNFHFTLGIKRRIRTLLDKGSFREYHEDLTTLDPIKFKGPKSYKDKLKNDQKATNLREAAIVGTGLIHKKKAAFGFTDSGFIMGSMGSVVGEKITRITELATEEQLPLIIVSGSGGGARMYEGMLSLMQMAKTSAALARHAKKGGLYISILTNPTMAGVLASFSSLGDIIIAEPKALIGFTGPRVIEQTIRQRLPKGFQSSEFLLDHGLIDMIVHRKELRDTLSGLLDYFGQ
ncbi:MAG: acetyl-CoA carboxylase carboxyltransferase subunit beta [Candidatus Omnitrophota bacterium]|nr:MAG: acetyl-CoA carboxylase carboxyltransferase subunit beta [Candidatus Omnitrophota bacterium]